MAIETLRPSYERTISGSNNYTASLNGYAYDNNLSSLDSWTATGDNWNSGGWYVSNISGEITTFGSRTQTWTSAVFKYKGNELGSSPTMGGDTYYAFASLYSGSNWIDDLILDSTTRSITVSQAQFDAGLKVQIGCYGPKGYDELEPNGGYGEVQIHEAWVEGTYTTDSFTVISPTSISINYGATVGITCTFTGQAPTSDRDKDGVTGTAAPWATWASGTQQTSNALITSRTFALTQASTSTTRNCVVSVLQAQVSAPTFSKNPCTVGNSITCSATVTQAAAPYNTVTWSGGTGSWAGSVFTPSAAGSHTITATANGTVFTNSSTLTVYTAASISSLSANYGNPVLYGQPTTVQCSFANAGNGCKIGTTGAGTSDVSASATTGTYYSVGNITASKTIYARATNLANDYVDSNFTITVQTVAVAAITGATTLETLTQTTFAGAAVSGAYTSTKTWSVYSGGGSITQGGVYTAGSPGTVVIRATSDADGTKYASKTITVTAAVISSQGKKSATASSV